MNESTDAYTVHDCLASLTVSRVCWSSGSCTPRLDALLQGTDCCPSCCTERPNFPVHVAQVTLQQLTNEPELHAATANMIALYEVRMQVIA